MLKKSTWDICNSSYASWGSVINTLLSFSSVNYCKQLSVGATEMKRRRRNSAGVENSEFESDGDSRSTDFCTVKNGRRTRGD